LVAVTVNVLVLPETIVAGLATIVTIAAAGGTTVTVAVAEALPPLPVATAVYVVVVAGLTVWVPPVVWRP
jgi:hypothetical protein